jgi:hypothetical protein
VLFLGLNDLMQFEEGGPDAGWIGLLAKVADPASILHPSGKPVKQVECRQEEAKKRKSKGKRQ